MRLSVLSLVLALSATGVMAQTPAPQATQSLQTPPAQAPLPPAAGPAIPPGLNIFISPSGQPFRARGAEPYPVVAWFAQADTDKDGKISHEEFLFDGMAFFMLLDVNRDTIVNSPENTRYENQVAPEILRIDPRIAQPKNPGRSFSPGDMGADVQPDIRYVKRVQGAAQYSLIDEPQPIRGADANLDFRVSDAEWVAASEQRFTLLDRDGDGFLVREELARTPAQYAADAFGNEKPKKKKGFLGGGK